MNSNIFEVFPCVLGDCREVGVYFLCYLLRHISMVGKPSGAPLTVIISMSHAVVPYFILYLDMRADIASADVQKWALGH